MKDDAMKVGDMVWCPWKSCYLWYNGKAYNGKDYEFVDAGDRVMVMNAQEAEKLQEEKR